MYQNKKVFVLWLIVSLWCPGNGQDWLDEVKFDLDVLPVYRSLAEQYDSKQDVNQYLRGMQELNSLAKQFFGLNDTSVSHKPLASWRTYVRSLARMPGKPMENPLLYQGDIVLTLKQLEDIIENTKEHLSRRNEIISNRNKRTLTSLVARWWKSFPISYYFRDSEVNQTAVKEGIKMWTDNTCITFEENENARDAIVFIFGEYCNSHVGRNGGHQPIQLGHGCYLPGIIAHEIGHALGLFHEQARYDRKQHIDIDWTNVDPIMAHNFATESLITSFGVRYDYGSLMHYGPYSFNIYNRPVITTKDPNYFFTIGQRAAVAFADFKKVYSAYCTNECEEKHVCQNGGYGCKSTKCYCPDGFTGDLCQSIGPSSEKCGETELTVSSASQVLTNRGRGICYRLIMASFGETVKLTINGFHFPKQSVCDQEYLEIKYSDDLSVTGARFCRNGHHDKIISVSNRVLVIFKSLSALNWYNLTFELSNNTTESTQTPTETMTTPLSTNTFQPITTTKMTTPPNTTTSQPPTTTIMTMPLTTTTFQSSSIATMTTPLTTTTSQPSTTATTTTPLTTTTSQPSTTATTTFQPLTTTHPNSLSSASTPAPCPCGVSSAFPFPYPNSLLYPLPYLIPYPYPYLPCPYPHTNFTQSLPFVLRSTPVSSHIPENTTTTQQISPLKSSAAPKITLTTVNASWPYTDCKELYAYAVVPYKSKTSASIGEALGSILTSCIIASVGEVVKQRFKADFLGEALPKMNHQLLLAVDVDFTDFLDHISA